MPLETLHTEDMDLLYSAIGMNFISMRGVVKSTTLAHFIQAHAIQRQADENNRCEQFLLIDKKHINCRCCLFRNKKITAKEKPQEKKASVIRYTTNAEVFVWASGIRLNPDASFAPQCPVSLCVYLPWLISTCQFYLLKCPSVFCLVCFSVPWSWLLAQRFQEKKEKETSLYAVISNVLLWDWRWHFRGEKRQPNSCSEAFLRFKDVY